MLESVLVDNLIKERMNREWIFVATFMLDDGLAMKMVNNLKLKSLQTSIDFLLIIFDENNEVQVCGIEYKSRLSHST